MELKKYWEIIYRRKWVVLQALLVTVAATVIVSRFMDPVYDATAKVLVLKESEDLAVTIPGVANDQGTLNAISQESITTQMEIMLSGHIIRRVIDEIGMRERETIIQKTLGKITRKPPASEQRELRVKDFADPGILTAVLQKRWVEVDSEMESDVIEITGVSSDREEAMKIANKVADIYIDTMRSQNNQQAVNSVQYIREQMRTAEAEMEAAEEQLRKARLAAEELRNDRELAMQLNEDAGLSGGAVFSSRLVEDDPEVQELLSTLSDLEMRRASLRTELSPEHPEVVNLTAQIEVINKRLRDEVNNIVSAETMLLNQKFDELNIKKETYNMLVEQLDNAKMAEAMSLVNARIIESADMPREDDPLYPSMMMYVVIAVIMGIIFGLALAFLVEYLDETVYDADDLETDYPLLGSVPSSWFASSIKSNIARESELVRAIGRIQLNLARGLDEGKVFSVTSSVKKEGKTTITAYLGVLFAKSGKKTLLIDFNPGRPGLHRLFNIPNSRGIIDIIRQGELDNSIIFDSGFEQLNIIPCGSGQGGTFDIISSPGLPAVISDLKKVFDVIIIDTPGTDSGNEAFVISSVADTTIAVACLGRVSPFRFANMKSVLSSVPANVAGLIVNRSVKRS